MNIVLSGLLSLGCTLLALSIGKVFPAYLFGFVAGAGAVLFALVGS